MAYCWRRWLVLAAVVGVLQPAAWADDPTEGWSEYARYGDYLSAQMKSLQKFGYGMFVTKMRAADGPVCSTFWLYADAPAPGCMPEIAQMWRWNEFDFEFVPYTRAAQNCESHRLLEILDAGKGLFTGKASEFILTKDALLRGQGQANARPLRSGAVCVSLARSPGGRAEPDSMRLP